jgi:hypothetical protein
VNCDFRQLPNGHWQCPKCGYATKRQYDKPPAKNCDGKTTVTAFHLQAGDALAMVIREFAPGCGNGLCGEWIAKMNAWGIAGCREHREEILSRLEQSACEVGWFTWPKAAAILLTKPWFRASDPVNSILDEALRRAERL